MTWAAFERTAYQAARGWGVQPSEFWRLSVGEWWAELDMHIKESRAIEEVHARGGKSGGKGAFTAAEWEDARRRARERRERMNG